MGKIRTRIIGLEDVEKKQKEEQKEKAKLKMPKGEVVAASVEKRSTPDEKTGDIKNKKTEPKKETKKKVKQAKTRARGKKYAAARKQTDKVEDLSLNEAITLLKKIKYTQFDESFELHLNVLKTGLKGEIKLPHETGKVTRVKVVDDKVLEEIEKGNINFDILISHPSYMPKLAKFAKVLGPKGLMPTPKTGTVSDKPEEVAKKFSGGALRWKTEPKFPLIHLTIGKVSATDKNIVENAQTALNAVGKINIQKAYISTSMGPSLRLKV